MLVVIKIFLGVTMFQKIITGLAFASALQVSTTALSQSTEEVWQHHIEAWESRSLDEIAQDYSERSILILNNQVFTGSDQIKGVFSQLFKIFNSGKNRIDTPVLRDRFVYITWNFTPDKRGEFFGTDTFVIEDGKIILQTIASPLYTAFHIKPNKEASHAN
jgi:hypothetical protein